MQGVKRVPRLSVSLVIINHLNYALPRPMFILSAIISGIHTIKASKLEWAFCIYCWFFSTSLPSVPNHNRQFTHTSALCRLKLHSSWLYIRERAEKHRYGGEEKRAERSTKTLLLFVRRMELSASECVLHFIFLWEVEVECLKHLILFFFLIPYFDFVLFFCCVPSHPEFNHKFCMF